MYSILNKLSEYLYSYISKNITSYTFVACFKIVESLQCISKDFKKKVLKRVAVYISSKTCFVYIAPGNKLKNEIRRISH